MIRHVAKIEKRKPVSNIGPGEWKIFSASWSAEKFGFVVGIAKVMHLEPLIFVDGSQQETNLVLEIIQVDGIGRATGLHLSG